MDGLVDLGFVLTRQYNNIMGTSLKNIHKSIKIMKFIHTYLCL